MEQFGQLSEELDEAWQLLQDNAEHEDAWAQIVSNQEVDYKTKRSSMPRCRKWSQTDIQ